MEPTISNLKKTRLQNCLKFDYWNLFVICILYSCIFRTMTTLKHLNKKRNKIKRRTVSQKAKESKFTVSMFSVALVCVAGLLYIFQISGVATKGYEIEDYEKTLSELQRENQKMQIEIADLKSMDNLENESGKLSAIDYKDIIYITSISSAVAMER